jgi:hypothetical protein
MGAFILALMPLLLREMGASRDSFLTQDSKTRFDSHQKETVKAASVGHVNESRLLLERYQGQDQGLR